MESVVTAKGRPWTRSGKWIRMKGRAKASSAVEEWDLETHAASSCAVDSWTAIHSRVCSQTMPTPKVGEASTQKWMLVGSEWSLSFR